MTPHKPPSAPKRPETITQHGVERIDDYAWLKDADWQAVMKDPDKLDPDIRAYLEAENAYTDDFMADTEALQTRLFEEMKGRIKETDVSVPVAVDVYFYYSRTFEGKQYDVNCRKKGSLDGPEEVILDENVLAEGHEYLRVGAFSVSPDHELLAFSVDTAGSLFLSHIVVQIPKSNEEVTRAWPEGLVGQCVHQFPAHNRHMRSVAHLW